MVVTRRAPAPPMPSSRPQSTQQIPRVKGNVSPMPHNRSDISSTSVNGISKEDTIVRSPSSIGTTGHDPADSPSKKNSRSKYKSKKKSSKKDSSGVSSLTDLLTRIFLLWFTIYTLSVCPQDTQLQSPVCRGLSEYRRLVIDPYVLPPLRLALAHPSVAPYIEKVQPYTDRAVATVKPVAERTLYEWNARVVPQWNQHVVPQWDKRVIPLWKRYGVPQLQKAEAKIAPYYARVTTEYEQRVTPVIRQVSPYVGKTMHTLHQWQHKARPYIVLTAHKTYDGYQRAAPYARPVWEKLKLVLAQIVTILAEQRRQFVDPHVHKIWERVKELSSGKPSAPAAADMRDSITSRVSKVAGEAASVASSLISHTQDASVVVSSAFDATAFPAVPDVVSDSVPPATVESASSTSSDNVTSTVSSVSTSIVDTASSILREAVSVPASSISSKASLLSEASIPSVSSFASALAATPSSSASEMSLSVASATSSVTDALRSSVSSLSNVASETVSLALEAGSSSAKSALSPSGSSPPDEVAGSHIRDIPSPSAVPPQWSEDPDIDLDAFYAELGLQEIFSEPNSPTTETVSNAPVNTESEEEKAERQRLRAAKMAERRSDITARHSKWEAELAASIEANKKALRKALVALRKSAAAELKESVEIRAEVEGLVEEAEKFLRGAEKYLQTLSHEGRSEDEKRAMWERVTDKVDEKFAERLGQTEAVVNGWYMLVLDKELAEVRKVTDAVRDIADRGQADIGMDYAYLDDVTYHDWQRYHDLLKKSDNFTEHANSIQNGSHPSPPINPVLTQISDLQAEVQDVVVGFETRLRRIKRNGERILGSGGQQTDPENSEDESISILPIEDGDNVQSPADIDVPPVVIGRSKEEVMDALNRLADEDGLSTSSPQATELPSDPESIVRNIVEEESVAQSQEDVSPLAVHEEL